MKLAYKLQRLHYFNCYLRKLFHFIKSPEGEDTISGITEETVKFCVTDMIKIYWEFKSQNFVE